MTIFVVITSLSQCCRLPISGIMSCTTFRCLTVHILLRQSSSLNCMSWSIPEGCIKAQLLNSLTSLLINLKTASELVVSSEFIILVNEMKD